MHEPVLGVRGGQVRRRRVVGLPGRLWNEVERRAGHASVPVAGASTLTQRRSSATWITVGPGRREGRPQDTLERGVALDPHATRAARPRGRREVHGSEVRAGGRRAPVAILVGADHPVALVVEDDRHHVGALAHGGLDLGHRHAHAAVADERHDAPFAMHERRRERGREAVAHGPRGGSEERAGPPEPEPARQPARERPGVRRDDGVLGQQPVQVRDDPAGMDARAAPLAAVNDGGLLPGSTVGGVVPVARGDGLGEEHALLEARIGRAQECPGVGPDRQLGGGGEADGTRPGLEVHVHPALAHRRDPELEGGRLAQPGPEHQERIRGLEALADGSRAAEAGHAQEQRVVVGDDVAAPPAGDDGHVQELGEADQVVRAPGAQDTGTGDDERAAPPRRGS